MSASQHIRKFITQNFLLGFPNSLGDSDSFLERGVLDSTGVLELVGFLEETFGIRVAGEEMIPDNLDSIEKISAFVRRKTMPPVG
jgi:acyl carrier protein